MILGNRHYNRSPVPQAYIWVADYYDGTHLAEFDLETKKPNNYYSIDKDKLIGFGIIGQGSQLYFNVANGVFHVNNDKFSISYVANDIEYPLTGRTFLYNDIDQYKNASSDAKLNSRDKEGKFTNTIDCFNFGYKKNMTLNDTYIQFESTLSLPNKNIPYLQISITSDQDLNGQLIIRKNGLMIDQFPAPLKANHAGIIHWELR